MRIFIRQHSPLKALATLAVALLLAMGGAAQAAQPAATQIPEAGPGEPSVAPQSPAAEAPAAAGSEPQIPVLQIPTISAPPAPGAQQRARAKEALLSKDFDYVPANLVDPFLPFIKPVETGPVDLEETTGDTSGSVPAQQRPLTPLQKMSLGEIEKGLKAIIWGEMGRRAVIEDAAGKGYIVTVGTPAGANNGVITEVFADRLIIQQEVWDQQLKQMVPQIAVVKLSKQEK